MTEEINVQANVKYLVMADKITADFIIDQMKEYIENKQPVAPDVWINAAQKLNILLGDESDILFTMQQRIAAERVAMLDDQAAEGKKNVSEVRIRIEATDAYRQMRSQEAKIRQIEELIRIAKIQARLRDSEMHGGNV